MKKLKNAAARPAIRRRHAVHGLAMAAALAVVGCGGGGSEGSGETSGTAPPVAENPAVLSGVVATGAPMAGAKLKVVDSSGAEVCDTEVGAQGDYECTLAPGAKGPLALTASTAEQTLYSVAPTADSGTANVTPLTTLIVSRLSPTGNPAQFAEQLRNAPDLATPEKLDTLVAELHALLAPLQKAAGDKGVNPLSGRFAADGTGHDRLLDALQVSIRPEEKVANIEITMKVKPASDGAAPVAAAFQSGDKELPPPPPQELQLADSGIAGLVADFLDRMRACYALPLDQRIRGVAAGATTATGDAASVQAEACRTLFADDDPSAFLDNGLAVGSGAAFSGMYRQTATGATFDLGNFEYLRANGDVYITFRSLTTTGAAGYSALMLHKEDGKLKAVGNQYHYDARVSPIVQHYEFPLQRAFTYRSTGYNVEIANKVDADGQMLFRGAVVTAPDGRKLRYRPLAGRASMVIVRDDATDSATNVEQLAAEFVDPRTPGNPADKDPTRVFAAAQLSDEQLRASPDQGAWTVEWEHVDSGTANVIQSFRTISRAPTLGEVRQMVLPQFTRAFQDELVARADVKAYSGIKFGSVSASEPNEVRIGTASGGDGWFVPDGAMAPTWVGAFGRWADGAQFNDGMNVGAGQRHVVVKCTKQSMADTHCDETTGISQFVEGSRLYTFNLWGRTIRQVEQSSMIGIWKVSE